MYGLNSTSATADNTGSVSAVTEAKQTVSAKEGNKTEEKSADKHSSKEDVTSAVEELNNALDSMNVSREFRVDDSTNEVVVKIIDKDEQKVIRQIPSEEAIKLSKNIREMVGLLYDNTF